MDPTLWDRPLALRLAFHCRSLVDGRHQSHTHPSTPPSWRLGAMRAGHASETCSNAIIRRRHGHRGPFSLADNLPHLSLLARPTLELTTPRRRTRTWDGTCHKQISLSLWSGTACQTSNAKPTSIARPTSALVLLKLRCRPSPREESVSPINSLLTQLTVGARATLTPLLYEHHPIPFARLNCPPWSRWPLSPSPSSWRG